MNISRRGFLSGAAAFGLGGWRLFAAPPGWKPCGTPNLVFGVLSDTHIRTNHYGKRDKNYTDRHFISALNCFRERNVDAVVHCGDMAHCGQVEEMQFHADAWRQVFPDDRGIGGQKVERLFVAGNHDMEASEYGIGDLVKRLYPDVEKRKQHVLATDIAGNWERIWGEKYEGVWHKTVKGYHFFGRHWGVPDGEYGNVVRKQWPVGPDGSLRNPVFLMSHSHPFPGLRRLFRSCCEKANCNAVNFFGHWHHSSANWNVATMFNDSGPVAYMSCPSCFSSRGDNHVGWKDSYIANARIVCDKATAVGQAREGYIVSLYDDMLTIERHEFSQGGSLGADWVMPFGKCDPHPFSKDELKKVIGEPQFREGAKLLVECCQCENVAKPNVTNGQLETGTGNGNNSTMATVKPSATPRLCVRIPLADGNPDSRVYAYEVVVVGDEGTPKLHKAVYAAGCNMGIGHEPNGGVTTLEILKSELPPGKTLTVAVRPLTSLGTAGKPIAARLSI